MKRVKRFNIGIPNLIAYIIIEEVLSVAHGPHQAELPGLHVTQFKLPVRLK